MWNVGRGEERGGKQTQRWHRRQQTCAVTMARRAVYEFTEVHKVRGSRRTVDEGKGSVATFDV